MSSKERALGPLIERQRKKTLVENRGIRAKARAAVGLLSSEAVLIDEDDLAILKKNEREYTQAVFQNRLILGICKGLRTVGQDEANLRDIYLEMTQTGFSLDKVEEAALEVFEEGNSSNEKQKYRILSIYHEQLSKIPRFYEDEYNDLINQLLKEGGDLSIVDLVDEQVRVQWETLALVRLQIEYLKKQKQRERKVLEARQREEMRLARQRKDVVYEPQEAPLQEISAPVEEEPFVLSGWQVFWTDVRFSRDANHLTPMPTNSKGEFVAALDRVNLGHRKFQIKPQSVVSCLETSVDPAMKQRLRTARFKYGPEHVREWSKLPRGGSRIMVNSDEGKKVMVFFACDRDVVYRGIFAGMS